MQVAIKLEGIEDMRKFFQEYSLKIIPAAEKGIKTGMNLILNSAKGHINNISGETAESLKAAIDGKGKSFVVGHIGTLGATRDECIRANSLEYGHAGPGQGIDAAREERRQRIAGGEIIKRRRRNTGSWVGAQVKKTTPPHPFIRPAIDENKAAIKQILRAELERALRGK
jgi:HK97 gp10 family phage protein